MDMEFAALQENIEACEAQIAASADVIESMAHCLGGIHGNPEFSLEAVAESVANVTSGAIPRGLLRCATDGERADGRLAWAPGATA